MLDGKKIGEQFEEWSSKWSEMIKNSPAKDLEKNVRAGMQSMFNHMDLLTREEYDVHLQVVDSLQKKLRELEARIESLESKAGSS